MKATASKGALVLGAGASCRVDHRFVHHDQTPNLDSNPS